MQPIYLLLGIIVAVSLYCWENRALMEKFMFQPYVIKERGEYYRFLTSGFIHADYRHLIFNMMVFYFFSRSVAQDFAYYFGVTWVIHFYLLFLLGIIVSSIPTYFKYQQAAYYRSLGASGGVSSVVFAFIVLRPTQDVFLFFVQLPALVYGLLYLIYSHYQSQHGQDNVNHSAHLWGAIFGIIYPLVLRPQVALDFVEQMRYWQWPSFLF